MTGPESVIVLGVLGGFPDDTVVLIENVSAVVDDVRLPSSETSEAVEFDWRITLPKLKSNLQANKKERRNKTQISMCGGEKQNRSVNFFCLKIIQSLLSDDFIPDT